MFSLVEIEIALKCALEHDQPVAINVRHADSHKSLIAKLLSIRNALAEAGKPKAPEAAPAAGDPAPDA